MLKPEIIYDLPFAAYCEIDALNQSRLKLFKKTPLHARHEILHGKIDTQALVVGHASHTMILEPEKFRDNYAVFADDDIIKDVMAANPATQSPRATKIYKDAKAIWEAKHAGHAHLTACEYARCRGIQAAVASHPIASQLLYGDAGENELTLVWELPDGKDGHAKARIDRLTRWNKFNCVVDVKTWNAKDADAILDQRSVEKQIHQYGYHNQAAWYLDGLSQLAPANYTFIFVFVEQEAPHDVAVYELSEEAIEKGRAENAARMEQYLDCKKTDRWPGVSAEIKPVGLPVWAA